jgi:predicted nucleotidyltransferase
MTLTDLPTEEQRVCDLVREETTRRTAGEGPFSLYLVGSRATGETWPTSDFDFVIDADEPLPGKIINPLREALEHLRVPYTIDLLDWHQCSEAFREVADPQRVGVS